MESRQNSGGRASVEVLQTRQDFMVKFCRKKGWPLPGDPDFKGFDIAKISEIREHPEWQDPLGVH